MILSLSTSSGIYSAALWQNAVPITQKINLTQKGDSSGLSIFVEQFLQENSILLHKIKKIAIDVGPGSFTGIRAGIAYAAGLTLFSEIELVGINLFMAIRAKYKNAQSVAVVIGGGNSLIQNIMGEIQEVPLEKLSTAPQIDILCAPSDFTIAVENIIQITPIDALLIGHSVEQFQPNENNIIQPFYGTEPKIAKRK